MNDFKHSSTVCLSGQQIGNYRLIRSLGEGGFAEVYLAEHIHLGTYAAIKVLLTQLGEEDAEAFRTEAKTIAHLIHPNIVRVLDFGIQRKTPFLVMDYAPGGTLRRCHPAGTRLVPSSVLQYVKEIAGAVAYIHSKGFIHRDIKPENMLLGSRNELLLSDFGITIAAQAIAHDELVVKGTLAYMAPEQINGNVCFQSDQYALAVVVYEWLSGYPPFRGSVEEIVDQHFNPVLLSLCASVPLVPRSVEKVVFKALAINPRERFESVQAFADALQDAFEPRPIVIQQNGSQHLRLQQPPSSKQGETQVKVQKQRNMQTMMPRDVPPRRRQNRSRGTKSIWKEIALFYTVDLLAAAALGITMAVLGVAPFLLALLMALWLVLFPMVRSLIVENTTLFFLSISITIVAAMTALLASSFVAFDVTYIGLLMLSLLTAFAVSIHVNQ